MAETLKLESPVAEAPAAKPERQGQGSIRLMSLDAFRGMVMLLILDERMHLPEVARAFPNSAIWSVIAYNTEHVPWQGCSLHDLIQPAFSFLVGASLPFSLLHRRARGESFPRLLGHAVSRIR